MDAIFQYCRRQCTLREIKVCGTVFDCFSFCSKFGFKFTSFSERSVDMDKLLPLEQRVEKYLNWVDTAKATEDVDEAIKSMNII